MGKKKGKKLGKNAALMPHQGLLNGTPIKSPKFAALMPTSAFTDNIALFSTTQLNGYAVASKQFSDPNDWVDSYPLPLNAMKKFK